LLLTGVDVLRGVRAERATRDEHEENNPRRDPPKEQLYIMW
jgi:hypothetical protein